jgi:endonuclease/exonuclease/phosphatase family metal-dependent hydrolase
LITVAAVSTLFAATGSAREPLPLRLMTYNIRLDLASDGMNSWAHRRDWVAAQVEWLRPDLFGMQEVVPGQKSDLVAALPRYRVFGGGRDGNDKGEASPIGFDTRRFDFLEGGMYWLSPTPDVPSMGWDAAYKRVATWVRLRVHGTKQALLVTNTHWDNEGAVARHESALQIGRWIAAHKKSCERVIVLGDFNTEENSEPLQTLRQSLALRDARTVSKTPPLGPAATFNAFRNPPEDTRAIDHFLVGEGIDVERYTVLSQLIDGRWPSDHFPVVVDLSVAECR